MAKSKRTKMLFNSFWCIKCGNKSYELPRQRSYQHADFHRKKLWCPNCKCEINHIECKDDSDVFDFKNMFDRGDFIGEAESSISLVRSASVG